MKAMRTKKFFAVMVATLILFGIGEAAMAVEPKSALRALEDAFAQVAEETSKSVVVITVTSKMPAMEVDMEEFEGLPFERWFGPDWRERMPRRPQQPRPQEGQGSGFIISADGYILTNNHVVENAEKIEVRLRDGRKFAAKVKGADPRTDVAVIKIEDGNLPVAKLGDSDKARVGQWALAIGAPFHLDYSVTVGIISGKGRAARGTVATVYEDFLQTDASINPGNSGGPLVDIDGKVVGINTAIRGMNTGIGFAIPINLAKNIAGKLIANGKIVRPWLGIEPFTPEEAREMHATLKAPAASVIVKSVHEDTPAARAGLRPADAITAVNGAKVSVLKELQQEIQQYSVGEVVTLEVWRDGKKNEMKVTLAELKESFVARGGTPQPPVASDKLGLRVEEFTKEDATAFGAPNLRGVRVVAVAPESPASRIGLREGDVITEMDRKSIASVEDFRAAIVDASLKKGVEIHYTAASTRARTFGILRDNTP